MSPGCVGCQPVSSRVSVLDAGMSSARNWASQVKCPAASSGAMDATGRERCLADHLGDVADRHAFVGDRVQRRSRLRIFYRQPEEVRGVEPPVLFPRSTGNLKGRR